ncbi:MAG TPA: RNA-guided endonuclease TnpB family protein [Ktedonobacterales bacterium]|nr:RNA-guided endonuclease TnpB family protein [Ktedonobacterales bacterium]
MRTFEYHLYPNRAQRQQLMACLIESRAIYNEMLAALKAQYEETATFPTKYDLTARFKGRGGEHVPATTVQTLADRLSKALKRYLQMKDLGLPVGFPRFKTANRWHSIQLRQYAPSRDVWLDDDGKHLHVPAKVGKSLKIKLHRPLEGTPVTAHLVLRADGHWYALIVYETEPQDDYGRVHERTEATPQPTCEHPDIGLDVGLKVFLADSDGAVVENPRYYRCGQKRLATAQRVSGRRKKGSYRRRKAKCEVAKKHLKIARQRRDFHFKTAKQYAERYRRICVEDLNVAGMVKNHSLAKSIHDASWSAFLDILTDKAERAGHVVVRVPARFTSQKCNRCGEYVQKSLSVRTHICPFCGLVEDRDVNAAKNIKQAGALPSGTGAVGLPVELRSPRL